MHSTAQIATAGYDTAVVINHLDKQGAMRQAEYWDKHIFTNEMLGIIRNNKRVEFFQDSLEIETLMSSNLYWCTDFLSEFEKRRGYDLTPMLPVLIEWNHRSMVIPDTGDDDPPRFDFAGAPQLRRRALDNLHLTQTELYRERYLHPLRRWLNGHGIKLRAQASYGARAVSFEMTLPMDAVDYQETESFEMTDVIDYYRVHSGGVHLLGKSLYSAETGALGGSSYTVSLKEYLKMIHRLYAGGVNRIILHGYSSVWGPDQSTQWPGYDGIGFAFSDRWGERNPYGFAIRDFNTYIARMQTALRTGTPKVDVGILNLMFNSPESTIVNVGSKKTPEEMHFWKDGNALAMAGFSYEFFAPQYLERKEIVSDGRELAPALAGYRAIVAYQEGIPEASMQALCKAAETGLPVILVGSACTQRVGLPEENVSILHLLEEMKKRSNVKCCASEKAIPSVLKALQVLPRVAFENPTAFYSVWREDKDNIYLYLMNAGESRESTVISIEGKHIVHRIDCWRGNIISCSAQYPGAERTRIRCTLNAGDAALYLLQRRVTALSGQVRSSELSADMEKENNYKCGNQHSSDPIESREDIYAACGSSPIRGNAAQRETPVN